jgi:hypothetical protein
MTQGKSNQDKEGPLDYIESSSAEKSKLKTLSSTNKSRPKVIKSHEDSENSKSKIKIKSSSKIYFWGSPYLSPVIEKLFNAMHLYGNSKSLIISINLCTIKNMIHLSNLELDEFSNLFLRNDIQDSNF